MAAGNRQKAIESLWMRGLVEALDAKSIWAYRAVCTCTLIF